MNTTAIYVAAAIALDAGQAAAYQAIRAEAPALDWAGHDRRAARLAGQSYADQGPDPALAHLSIAPAPPPALDPAAITTCRSCGARVWWSDTQGGAQAPYNVADDNTATRINHFTTCPQSRQWRRGGSRKATR